MRPKDAGASPSHVVKRSPVVVNVWYEKFGSLAIMSARGLQQKVGQGQGGGCRGAQGPRVLYTGVFWPSYSRVRPFYCLLPAKYQLMNDEAHNPASRLDVTRGFSRRDHARE